MPVGAAVTVLSATPTSGFYNVDYEARGLRRMRGRHALVGETRTVNDKAFFEDLGYHF